jgi:hypothetical protein
MWGSYQGLTYGIIEILEDEIKKQKKIFETITNDNFSQMNATH